MKKCNILILGYGIDAGRTEAVSVNVSRLLVHYRQLGYTVYLYNIGYSNPYAFTGNSLWQALWLRNNILQNLRVFCQEKKITHLHDVFVLPLASIVFTEAISAQYHGLKVIKEVHNDAGFSRKIHTETLIRILANQQWMLMRLLRNFICYTRNPALAKKYHLTYIPQPIALSRYQRSVAKDHTIKISYLGHPLLKKGVYEFPKLITLLGNQPIKYHFSCAFSDLSDSRNLIIDMQEAAKNTSNVTLSFQKRVRPHQFFSQQDYYLLPIQDQYGAVSTPNTILEAMEAGAIPIVTDLASLKGIISHGKTGILVTAPTAQAFYKTLVSLQKNSSYQTLLRHRARLFIEKNFAETMVIERLKKLYE